MKTCRQFCWHRRHTLASSAVASALTATRTTAPPPYPPPLSPAAAGPKPARRSTPRRRTPHPNLCAAILTGLPRHPNLPRHPILRRHPNLRRQVNLSRRPNVCGATHPSHPHPTCALGPLALCYLPRRQRDANAKRVDPSGEVL